MARRSNSPAFLGFWHEREEQGMRYAVDTGAVRRSADAVCEALSRLERMSPADDLSRVRVAVPGGQTATLASLVCLAWEARLAETRSLLKTLGCLLSDAAGRYDAVESEARTALGDAPTAAGPSGSR
jgi:hypothetical protein